MPETNITDFMEQLKQAAMVSASSSKNPYSSSLRASHEKEESLLSSITSNQEAEAKAKATIESISKSYDAYTKSKLQVSKMSVGEYAQHQRYLASLKKEKEAAMQIMAIHRQEIELAKQKLSVVQATIQQTKDLYAKEQKHLDEVEKKRKDTEAKEKARMSAAQKQSKIISGAGNAAMWATSGFATAGITGGIGGGMSSMGNAVGGLARGGLGMAGKGLGSLAGGPAGATIGAAIGDSLGAVFGGLIQNAIAVEMWNMQKYVISQQGYNVQGRTGGFDKQRRIGRFGYGLSSEETLQMLGTASGFGLDLTSPQAQKQFVELTTKTKVWGESIHDVLQVAISETGSYQKAMDDVGSLYTTSREGAHNLNIELSQMAKMYTQVGVQARYMGIDANKAKGMLQSIVQSPESIQNLMNVGLDMRTQGAQIVSGAMGAVRNMNPTMQYYYGSNRGRDNTSPMDAWYKAQFGSTAGASYNRGSNVMTYGQGMDLGFVSAMKDDISDLMNQFMDQGKSSTEAMGLTQQIMKERGMSLETTKLLAGTEKRKLTGSDFQKKLEDTMKDPLERLASFAYKNESFSQKLVNISEKLNPMAGHIFDILNTTVDIFDFMTGRFDRKQEEKTLKDMNTLESLGIDYNSTVGDITPLQRKMGAINYITQRTTGQEYNGYLAWAAKDAEGKKAYNTMKSAYEFQRPSPDFLKNFDTSNKTYVSQSINTGGGSTIKIPGKMIKTASSVVLELDNESTSDAFKQLFQGWSK